ncbi:response regulator [Acuticoccus sp. I52.16.1]|uniref:response regulator n=1 Tax=Acuticoccus sp. I52.16.1 TaxID=2928472 RepID=UPI001FD3D6D0|nr:response regulator [Acuticoccus sp. I52.16.1]UOM34121.1 response regulator [Acuticoccus sp. I52.16.1]
MAGQTAPPLRLQNVRVLLVEDESLIGMLLELAFVEAGATVIGPLSQLEDAVLAAQEDSFDVAVLDVDLNGKDAYPAADVLEDRGIPFVFHTGHGTKRELRASYPTAPVIKKPTPPEEIITQLAKLV